jgi:hypothetical protein
MSVAIIVELPESVAEILSNTKIDLSRTALEVIALESYRSNRLTGFQVMVDVRFRNQT